MDVGKSGNGKPLAPQYHFLHSRSVFILITNQEKESEYAEPLCFVVFRW